jgi:hypothetical protein
MAARRSIERVHEFPPIWTVTMAILIACLLASMVIAIIKLT